MNLSSSHNHLRPQNELADRKFLRIYFFAYIKIDPPWSMTLNKKRFLIYQESKLLIFANDFGLKLLALSKNCLADGTFKTAPSPLYQIYTIFGSSKEWKFPVVWALLGQKSNKNYQNFFGMLRRISFMPENLSQTTRRVLYQLFENVLCLATFWLLVSLFLVHFAKNSGIWIIYFLYERSKN